MSEEQETVNAQMQRLASLGFMVAKRSVTHETLEKGLASISLNIARACWPSRAAARSAPQAAGPCGKPGRRPAG
ncbi:MAG: hypothetical protein E6H47_15415 [Betaproteobacteria bacterium]|nr:MAG: hypothetical protein E6H47_15415 [Betaproteobacteria bacterium]